MKVLFRKYGNAAVDSFMDWSHDVCHKFDFMWPGLGTMVIGQVPCDNGHEALFMGQRF